MMAMKRQRKDGVSTKKSRKLDAGSKMIRSAGEQTGILDYASNHTDEPTCEATDNETSDAVKQPVEETRQHETSLVLSGPSTQLTDCDASRYMVTRKAGKVRVVDKSEPVCTKPWTDIATLGSQLKQINDDEAQTDEGMVVGYTSTALERKHDPNWQLVEQFAPVVGMTYQPKPVYWRYVSQSFRVVVESKQAKPEEFVARVEMPDGRNGWSTVHQVMMPYAHVKEACVGRDGTLGDEVYLKRMEAYMTGTDREDRTKHKLKLLISTRPVFVPSVGPESEANNQKQPSALKDSWLAARTRNTELEFFRLFLDQVVYAYACQRVRGYLSGELVALEDNAQVMIRSLVSLSNVPIDGDSSEDAKDDLIRQLAGTLIKQGVIAKPYFAMKPKGSTKPTARVGFGVSMPLAFTVKQDQPMSREIARDPFLREQYEQHNLDHKKVYVLHPEKRTDVEPNAIVASSCNINFFLHQRNVGCRLRNPKIVVHSNSILPVPGADLDESDPCVMDWGDKSMFPDIEA